MFNFKIAQYKRKMAKKNICEGIWAHQYMSQFYEIYMNLHKYVREILIEGLMVSTVFYNVIDILGFLLGT